MKIEPIGEAAHLEMNKRTYLPFVLTDVCPECGVEVTRDLSGDYLSYPTTGQPEAVRFYHETPDAEHEWEREIIIEMSIREVAP